MALNLANILDASGNAAHGIVGGTEPPSVVASPWGFGTGALSFAAGKTQSVALPGGSLVLPSGDYTIDLRFKRTRTATTEVLFARWNPGVDYSGSYALLYFGSDDKLSYLQGITGPSSVAVTSSSTIADTSAHSLRVVKSSGSLSLYIDGTRVAGPTTCGAPLSVGASIPWRLADYDDPTQSEGLPFVGTVGELHVSNSARSTGASYTVATSAASADGNTLLLWACDHIAGTYLGAWSSATKILDRSASAYASGGWANPDGPWIGLDGHLYFSVSGYSVTNEWVVFCAQSSDDTISGTWTLTSATPLQGPSQTINGSILPWNGTYYHWGHTYAPGGAYSIAYSTNSNLTSAFSSPTNITGMIAGTGGYVHYVDPLVRVSPDSTYLEMLLCALPTGATLSSSERVTLRSTSTNGTTWTTPVLCPGFTAVPGFNINFGEPSWYRDGSNYWGFGDSATGTAGTHQSAARSVFRYASTNGTDWVQLRKAFGPTSPYLAAFDSSPWRNGNRLYCLFSHADLTNNAEPVDSDIAFRYAYIVEDQTVTVSSIASAEAFGTATVTASGAGTQTVSPSSIVSAESFGTATVTVSTTGITYPILSGFIIRGA